MRAILGALVVCSMVTPAMAQQPTAPTPSAQAAPIPATGQWRASKLIGVNIYNEANEKLGEINELVINRSGQVAGAVIGVGGFLGMG